MNFDENHDDDDASVAVANGTDRFEARAMNLTWRRHPSDTFSDWKIRVKSIPINAAASYDSVVNTSDSTVEHNVSTYYVHRICLAFGERRSEYFSSLFHYAVDDGDRCTNIEIASRAADHFPELLDYMYFSRSFVISTSNAVPLLFLARSLQISSLQSSVEEFLDKDVRKLFNFGTYLSDAVYFSDPRIVGRVRDTGGKEVLELTLCESSNGSVAEALLSPISVSAGRVGTETRNMWLFLTRLPKRLAYQVVRFRGKPDQSSTRNGPME